MNNCQEHFQAFLIYAFIPLLFIGMIGVIFMLFALAYDWLKDRFPQFPKHTATVDTTIPRIYIRVVHIDNIEASQEQSWELIGPHPTNPDYVVMTKSVEDESCHT